MNSQAVLCLPHSAPPPSPLLPRPEAYAYTDGASTGSRGPGGYGVVIRWEGKTKEISGGELNTTNLRMELAAACVALETIGEGYTVSVYSDASYLINCMRRGWYKKDQSNQYRESASSQTPRLRGSLVVGT
ncbi:MAG TPA: RNase H family protein [Rubrobacter sp.]|jgi:ribonuclease HI|nr:RNase H family protein [Rubrobacter sp.]